MRRLAFVMATLSLAAGCGDSDAGLGAGGGPGGAGQSGMRGSLAGGGSGVPAGGTAGGASVPSAMGGAPGSGGSAVAGLGGSAGTGAAGTSGAGGNFTASSSMNFFVTSDTSKTANLSGLAGADMRCQRLAMAAGAGAKTWRAYLSVANPATNARDRIAEGPYYNSKGALLAATKDALHARTGDHSLFIDEKGAEINGQWNSSGNNNEHDVLTGSTDMGLISPGNTCGDWTATTGMSLVGHTDGLGPMMSKMVPYIYWAGAHTGSCGDTKPGGGSGRLYCFVGP